MAWRRSISSLQVSAVNLDQSDGRCVIKQPVIETCGRCGALTMNTRTRLGDRLKGICGLVCGAHCIALATHGAKGEMCRNGHS